MPEKDSKAKKFYVTTPIYYATARPHLGSLYSTVLADVAARWHQLQGYKTFFLTGTDEHGQKIAQAAEKAGKDPKDFVDSFIDDYKDMWSKYDLDYNRFIRTTDLDHVAGVQKWLQDLIDKDLIYKDKYEGNYCTPCETFVLDKDLKENDNLKLCPSCNRETKFITEENYFFRLSSYQDKLLNFYKSNPDFITPKEKLNEVTSFVSSGLRDLCLSRSTVKWGIKFPNDSKHVAYVWADALNNYITGIGYKSDNKKDLESFNYYWPADLQVLGKDILRFHAVYWPAFLMASDLPLPKKLLIHGWIKVGDQKMSKSLGNTVDPEDLYNKYGSDAIRYYLTSQMAITRDSEFSIKDLEQKLSSDLANDLGNLLNRAVILAKKNNSLNLNKIDNFSEISTALKLEQSEAIASYLEHMNNNYYYLACAELWRFIKRVNSYFHEQEPWKLFKNNPEQFKEVISATCHSLYTIANLLWPIMPNKSIEILSRLGKKLEIKENKDLVLELNKEWNMSFDLVTGDPVFEKFDTKPDKNKNLDSSSSKTSSSKSDSLDNKDNNHISFEDFLKVELIVGTIESCEEVLESEKLLKMQVNFGDLGSRQVISGIKKYFKPEDLINQQGTFVLNLKPRKIMGLESQAMMLFSKNEKGDLVRILPQSVVPNGSRLV